MFRNKINFTVVSVLLLLIITIVSVYGQQDAPGMRKLMVFFSPTCHKCIEVKKELMPAIEKIFKDKIITEYRDISDIKKIFLTPIYILLFLGIYFSAYSQIESPGIRKLMVFFSPTCHRCIEVKNELMPQIEKIFKDKIAIEYRDISDIENYKLLLSLKEKYSAKDLKIMVPVFLFEGNFLSAEEVTKDNLERLITDTLNRPAIQKIELSPVNLLTRFKAFEPLAIVGIGLIDGINPCAFTVIVFFISFLALQGYKKRELIPIGLSFIFAVFITYILIGLGLFGLVYHIEGFWLIRKIFNISIGIFSIIIGILSLYDFVRFKKTNKTEGLLLQLPSAIKNRIHYIIGLNYRKTKGEKGEESVAERHIFRLIITALVTGFLVSIIEAVCTGQTYLPTIVFIFKTTSLKLQALGYLLLYNFMFIVPLLIIFVFALLGTSSEEFSVFLKKNLLTIKLILAILFFGIGIFLIWRA